MSKNICVLTQRQADFVTVQLGCLRDHVHHRHTSRAKAEHLVETGRARWFAVGLAIEVLAGRTGEWRPRESTEGLTEFGIGHIVMQRV